MKSELYELNKITDEELSNSIVNDTDVIGNKYIANKLNKDVNIYLYSIISNELKKI